MDRPKREVEFTIRYTISCGYEVGVHYTFSRSGIGSSKWESFSTFEAAVKWLKDQEGVKL